MVSLHVQQQRGGNFIVAVGLVLHTLPCLEGGTAPAKGTSTSAETSFPPTFPSPSLLPLARAGCTQLLSLPPPLLLPKPPMRLIPLPPFCPLPPSRPCPLALPFPTQASSPSRPRRVPDPCPFCRKPPLPSPFPRTHSGHQQGVVPGGDQRHHTQRLAPAGQQGTGTLQRRDGRQPVADTSLRTGKRCQRPNAAAAAFIAATSTNGKRTHGCSSKPPDPAHRVPPPHVPSDPRLSHANSSTSSTPLQSSCTRKWYVRMLILYLPVVHLPTRYRDIDLPPPTPPACQTLPYPRQRLHSSTCKVFVSTLHELYSHVSPHAGNPHPPDPHVELRHAHVDGLGALPPVQLLSQARVVVKARGNVVLRSAVHRARAHYVSDLYAHTCWTAGDRGLTTSAPGHLSATAAAQAFSVLPDETRLPSPHTTRCTRLPNAPPTPYHLSPPPLLLLPPSPILLLLVFPAPPLPPLPPLRASQVQVTGPLPPLPPLPPHHVPLRLVDGLAAVHGLQPGEGGLGVAHLWSRNVGTVEVEGATRGCVQVGPTRCNEYGGGAGCMG